MNAPLLRRDAMARNATLHLFALFHLNLAFSSIEEEQRGEVIRRCYWPLLRLAHDHGPVGLEATGFTLEEIAARDPEWCAEAARLIKCGQIEFIGSGYSQIIGPLVPAKVTEANLRIGDETYRRMLGVKPSLALVNEQAYASGLVGLYRDAGYDAILMDWDNPAAHHPEWSPETRYLPQRALGADGRDIALLWTSTVAFQKLQRLAHGDIAPDDYIQYVTAQRTGTPRALCLYASDAEIFDFRPGRYRTEESLGGEDEWARIEDAFATLKAQSGVRLMAPSEALGIDDFTRRPALRLESAACPVPVKKQRKYNLSRWAVTGRDDLGINAACERVYAALLRANVTDTAAWKELCYLWSSDFRTHITDERWKEYCARLAQAEAWWVARDGTESKAQPRLSLATYITSDDGSLPRHIAINTPAVKASLDRKRGLAISRLQFAGNSEPIVGGLPHGHFDDIGLQADWYTGDCVFEAPGEHKITDLEWCEPVITTDWNGDVIVRADIATVKGPIRKELRFCAARQTVEFDLRFDWDNWDCGVLRLGHFTLLPQAFDWDELSLTTHNGGKDSETFSLKNQNLDHGAPVSFLVSSSFGIGMTEGWAELGDVQRRVRVEIDRETAPLLGLLSHRRVGGSLFCQLALSALELDETRKPSSYRSGPRRFRFSISRAATSVHC
jgi:hypothetical protein